MSNIGDSIKNFFGVNSEYDDYDDDYDYDHDYETDVDISERPAKQEKKKNSSKLNFSREAADEDDISDEYNERHARTSFAKRPSNRSSKVVQMNNERNRNIKAEIFTIKPTTLDDSKEIVDALLEGKAIILNFEGANTDLAQRIIDNVSGACCAVNGTLKRVSAYIYIVTPISIELYGDYNETTSSNSYFKGNRYQY